MHYRLSKSGTGALLGFVGVCAIALGDGPTGSPSTQFAAARLSLAAPSENSSRVVDMPLAIQPLELRFSYQPDSVAAGSAASESEARPGAPDHHNAQNEANNPLTPKITFNLHDYFVPSFFGLDDRTSNQLLIRGVVPHKVGELPQLFRFTFPVVQAPTGIDDTQTGVGDLTLIDWFVLPVKGIELAVGPVLVLPTASDDALGAGKWQAGASGIAISAQQWGIIGGMATFQQSFAGDSDREEVTILTFQPFFIYNLPAGFYLRSTAIWNFDLHNDSYYVPFGAGVGKVWNIGQGVTMNTFIEPQFTVFHDGDGVPQWQVFAGVNFQFPF